MADEEDSENYLAVFVHTSFGHSGEASDVRSKMYDVRSKK